MFSFECRINSSNGSHRAGSYASLAVFGWRLLVQLAFKSPKIVPWSLRNRWDNCLFLLNSFRFQVTHIYREGNKCADILANIGLALSSHFWYNDLPLRFWQNLLGTRLVSQISTFWRVLVLCPPSSSSLFCTFIFLWNEF
jgi:hypothetical protein